ncbi:uncharacterized protein NECHADRAFT_78060 [Fusarium vanettenii 77-13-4]|uniref:Uncharacterized protein n=1 Tax=Fusarium vanettenii (strain ATCC MYA-4622 / CBS 123669 / FGSC 9596 / NRRL 45880 / 77-13-4) TaxID=660122 RepID=C7YN03_FUSV7|nr:uncharacterized protein NECHADRAFT_78060 [Fusarium vanettenii 77-13-4]EEU47039.1 predicted protein [Fusarium vanettenii 77-13-4]
MPFNFFSRRSSRPREVLVRALETADPWRLMVIDIVESYLTPLILPYPLNVYRNPHEEGHEFMVQLPKPINPGIEAKELHVKFKTDSYNRTTVYMSMPKPSKSSYAPPAPDRLYNWPTYMGPNYKYGPITVKMEDSVEGQWLSMTMHASFGADYVDFRVKQSIMEQGENVTLTGPRPDGMFALGCARLWSQ